MGNLAYDGVRPSVPTTMPESVRHGAAVCPASARSKSLHLDVARRMEWVPGIGGAESGSVLEFGPARKRGLGLGSGQEARQQSVQQQVAQARNLAGAGTTAKITDMAKSPATADAGASGVPPRGRPV